MEQCNAVQKHECSVAIVGTVVLLFYCTIIEHLMPLTTHTPVPDFTLPSTVGRDFTLSKHGAGKIMILYFYPKDFTPLCTEEACSFRDSFETFRDLQVDVVGISTDDIATHLRFKAAHNLPFELLSDPDSRVAKLYGAVMPIVGITRRKTFLIDAQGNLAAEYENNFSADGHIKSMIRQLS